MSNNQTLGLYQKYSHSEERGNEVWAFKYNNVEIRMYKATDMETEEDVWYMDFTDFVEAIRLQGVFPINLYNRIPIRFKSIQLCGNSDDHDFPHNYDQREAVNTKGFRYIFNDNTEGIEEIDMIRQHMESLHILPRFNGKAAPTFCKITCTYDEKDKAEIDKLFSPDIEDISKLKVGLNIDKIRFHTLKEIMEGEYNKEKNKKNKYKECRYNASAPEAKPDDNFEISIAFTRHELRALYLYMTKGLCPFLGDKRQLQGNLAGATAKIHDAYQRMPK